MAQLDEVIEIRRHNLQALCKEWDGPTNLSAKLGYKDGTYLSQMLHAKRSITEAKARDTETKLNLPPGWMDQRKHVRIAPEPDMSLVNSVLDAIGNALDKAKIKPTGALYTHLAKIICNHARAQGHLDLDFVTEVVALRKK